MKPRVALVAGTMIGLLALVLVLGGADTAHAGTFNPTFEITLSDPSAGAHSDLTTELNLPDGDVNFAALVFFIPGEWEITPAEEIPIGAAVGQLQATATLGILNQPCATFLPVEFIMLNASIDPSDTVSYVDTDPLGDPGYATDDVFDDEDESGLQDAIERYPDFITRVLVDEDDQPLTPIRRAAGVTIVAGVNVLLQFLVFEPGTFIDEQIPNDESLGYPSVTLLQNAGDPDFDPVPSAITDFCTPLLTTNITFGITRDNACTDDVPTDDLDPICEVHSALMLECDDFRDNDADLGVNDGCPAKGAPEDPSCANDADDDPDDDADAANQWINDGCPVRGESAEDDPGPDNRNCRHDDATDDCGTSAACAGDNAIDDDADGWVNDGCPLQGSNPEDPSCANDTDDDGDGWANDGCPAKAARESVCNEPSPAPPEADDDGDTTINDGCPTVEDEAETDCDDDEDNDGDDMVNDGCPPVEEPENSTPTDPDEGALVSSTLPAEGTYTFSTIGAGQRDADGDGYENALDTCPFDPNVGNPRIGGDGDDDTDGLDAACDPDDQNINSDEDLDGYMNRQDNCPLEPNGENEDNQRDTDDDTIGDACDPNPENADTEGEYVFANVSLDVTIGPGNGPTDGTPGDEDDGGGSAVIIIIVVVIAAVVVVGGGAFVLMRRGGGGSA